jgi:hypothetical protein
VVGRLGGRFDPPAAFEPVLGLLGEINPFDEQRQVRPLVAPGQLQFLFDRLRLQCSVKAEEQRDFAIRAGSFFQQVKIRYLLPGKSASDRRLVAVSDEKVRQPA